MSRANGVVIKYFLCEFTITFINLIISLFNKISVDISSRLSNPNLTFPKFVPAYSNSSSTIGLSSLPEPLTTDDWPTKFVVIVLLFVVKVTFFPFIFNLKN